MEYVIVRKALLVLVVINRVVLMNVVIRMVDVEMMEYVNARLVLWVKIAPLNSV
jgi:hypothetical protein